MIADRTSTEALSTVLKVEAPLPAARACRSLRTTFSTSMMASSTTTPMATTNPASTMTLTVAPAASKIKTAETKESGIAIKLMNAVRHSKRKAMMINATKAMPSSIATRRLSSDCSMNVAGRKIVVSTVIPGNPGCISRIASSTPRVTSTVFAPRYFCTTSSSPGPSSTTPSPISGPGSITTRPKSAYSDHFAVAFDDGYLADLLRVDNGLHVADVEPLTAFLDEAAGADDRAVAVLHEA